MDHVWQPKPIGFYAYMSVDEDHPGKHHILVFDTVKTNVGNGYNRYSGTNTYASYDIMKNGDIEGTFFVDAEHGMDLFSGSTTVVVSLQVGDVLFLRTSSTREPHGNIYSRYYARSSVSGWRIQ